MKIIDLLNKIANGEDVPKCVKYYNKLYKTKDTMTCYYTNIIYKLDNEMIDLLDEVEIIEENNNKIEKLNIDFDEEGRCDGIYISKESFNYKNRLKINEIIDKMNGGK